MKTTSKANTFQTGSKASIWQRVFSVAALAIFAFTSSSASATIIFADNFDAPNTSVLDTSDQTGRISGLLGTSVGLRSQGSQHHISGNKLLMRKTGGGEKRVRFHDPQSTDDDWIDFASGAAGTDILANGGFRVEFDWTPVTTASGNWLSVDMGIAAKSAGEPSFRVNNGDTDFGFLMSENGDVQYFDNGVVTDIPGAYSPTAGESHVVVDYAFASFADGSNATASASIDGVSIFSNAAFQWDGNLGVLNMELGEFSHGTLIDNLVISTVPEPSSILLIVLGSTLLFCRWKKKS